MDQPARIPMTPCPVCAYEMDAADCVSHEKSRPSPGDISLCMKCGEVLEFDEGLKLQQATVSTMLELGKKKELSETVARAQAMIRAERFIK